MDLDSLVQLISGVGFPIAACVALYLMNTKQLFKLTSIIENNTAIMNELKDKLKELTDGNK